MGQASTGFEPERLRALLESAGLSAACRPLPPEPAAKGPALLLARGEKPR
jgi:hypothetical protein